MSHQEVYQVWNPRQKMWVKMKNGRILENSSFKYEGLPVFGKDKPGPQDEDTAENNEPDIFVSEDEDEPEDESSGVGFF